MNRRQFIQRGLLGGLLLGLAGAGLALWPSERRFKPVDRLLHLSDRAFQVLVAIAARVVPEAKDPRFIVHRIDRSLGDLPPEARSELEQLLTLFDNALAGLVLDGHPRQFSGLDEAAQDAVLERWRTSRLTLRRSGFQAVRRLCLSVHYTEDDTHAGIGYRGPNRIPLSYEDPSAGVLP